ncbi:hypothetical protein, partial [Stenotrophomonas sp.]|uniref:hypothetical protein n=1 Tax=Stenotrophomonas sp. TaxID=69392 RepID=UPI00289D806F
MAWLYGRYRIGSAEPCSATRTVQCASDIIGIGTKGSHAWRGSTGDIESVVPSHARQRAPFNARQTS